MRERKTDDYKIVELLKEGKNQKQIAEYFGVSPVAICKRLKRLCPLPESVDKLSTSQRRFCVEKAKGKTNIQAVMDSYEVTSRESAKVIGSQLMAMNKVQTAINDLMEYHGIGKSFRVKRLADHVNNRDPHVSLKALDQSWKLSGDYIEKHMNLNANIDIDIVDLEKYR